MIKVLKLPLKLLALMLIPVCMLCYLLIKCLNNLSSCVIGMFMLFLLGCIIYSIVQQQWRSVLILGVLELASVMVMFGAVWLEMILESAGAHLRDFLHR